MCVIVIKTEGDELNRRPLRFACLVEPSHDEPCLTMPALPRLTRPLRTERRLACRAYLAASRRAVPSLPWRASPGRALPNPACQTSPRLAAPNQAIPYRACQALPNRVMPRYAVPAVLYQTAPNRAQTSPA